MVSYLGHPLSGAISVLGRLEPETLVRELKDQTRAYTKIAPHRSAIPTMELIASIAQPAPGSDGPYVAPNEGSCTEKYSRLADEAHALSGVGARPPRHRHGV